MRYLIVGGRGMLGSDVTVALSGRDVTVVGSAELDVTDRAAVLEAVKGFDVVVNTSAYTKVDDAETHESEAMAVNAEGPENLAIAAREAGAVLVHVSTDYVFDGAATAPYAENQPLAPLGAYGRSKAEGERRVLAAHADGSYIVRTAWLYGEHGPNFARTMLKLAESHPTVSVVDDQLGQPTWTLDLAAQIVALLDTAPPFGVYHGTNSGSATWFEFARAVFEVAGLDPERVVPTTSAAFVRPAPRPAYSVLGHDAWARAGIPEMRSWRAALEHSFLAFPGAVP